MRHPDSVASLLREKSTWRDLHGRRGRGHDDLSFEDACLLLGGCPPLAFQAFQLVHSEEAPGRELVRHLLGIAERVLPEKVEGVTPVALVELAIAEARSAESQRSERARYLFLGLTRSQWRHRAARPYSEVAGELDRLCGDAWRTIRRRTDEAA